VVAELRPTVVAGGMMAVVDVQSTGQRWSEPQLTVNVGAATPTRSAAKGTTVKPAASGVCPVQLPEHAGAATGHDGPGALGKAGDFGGIDLRAPPSRPAWTRQPTTRRSFT